MDRITIKFAGASGQGINATGHIFTKVLNSIGLQTFGHREYPSLIKGGVASYQVDCSSKPINSSTKKCNILNVLSEASLHAYIFDLKQYGILIVENNISELTPEEEIFIKKNDITVININSVQIAKDSGGVAIMANAVLLGFLWRILKQDKEVIVDEILKYFAKKDIDKEAEKKCILAGYNSPLYRDEFSKNNSLPKPPFLHTNSLTITGNDALSLGALSAGVRAVYAYPMTPATSIFKFLGDTCKETGILVKQAENEITAVQMALGSMYMGTRALTATSGGGFDLMIETIDCAGMSETPLVVVLAQRAGSGTGVPTWTGSADIHTATMGGHGEFPRCVIATSDAISNYTAIQNAFNIADIYQIPVILLTEKQIAEGLYCVDELPQPEKIERNLTKGENRYTFTDTGISPRWIPTKGSKPYLATSDEHLEDGTSTEDAQAIMQMTKKRMKKMDTLSKAIPEPEYFGSRNAKTVFVGCGSVKNTIIDVIKEHKDYGYLHYEFLLPLKTKKIEELIQKKKRLIAIESNQTGQLANLITAHTGYVFEEKLLKYDGRPFFIEDILDFINQ